MTAVRRKKGFGTGDKMPSAKFLMDSARQASIMAAEEEYLGAPPPDPTLIQASLVVFGEHMLSRRLHESTALHGIRKKHKVWITRVQDGTYQIHSDNVRRLQQAVRAINWTIHDLRLSDERSSTLFWVQKPAHVEESALVRVKLNSRPHVLDVDSRTSNVLPVVLDVFRKLYTSLVPSTEVLKTLGTDIKMRVNFGLLNVRQRKRGVGDVMTYAQFASMVSLYSARGGASMDTRLSGVHIADKVVQHLTDPAVGIVHPGGYEVQRRCAVILKIRDQELSAEAEIPSTQQQTRLSAARVTTPEKWSRLNWTMAAPDMNLDWNLQVDSCERMASIPAGLEALVASIVLVPGRAGGNRVAPLVAPRILRAWPRGNKVDETMLKTSALVPFRDTPFVIEVSVTQAWNGMETDAEPETWWGIELYGRHWDEAFNHDVSPEERRKNWGVGLLNMWPGVDESLERRFAGFLEHVVEIQSALGGVAMAATPSPM